MNSINKEIIEVLDDELRELREEIEDKKQKIEDKEKELEQIEEFEADDDFIDDLLDNSYGAVDIMGSDYPVSKVLKAIDINKYERIRDEETELYKETKRNGINYDLEALRGKLEELEENYKGEFENDE